MSRRLVPILLGIMVGASFLNLGLPSAQAACSYCRAYAVAFRDDAKNYTAIHAYITYNIPTIRDGGFSSEVLWVPNPNGGVDSIEMGWRRTTTGNPIIYWGYLDTALNWHMTNLGTNTAGHDYQIEHFQSDNKWHVFLDGVDRGSVTLSFSSSYLNAGGEVTDFSATAHNAMGISNFKNLSYKRNHLGYYSWSGWSHVTINYAYFLTGISNNEFQNGGYNP